MRKIQEKWLEDFVGLGPEVEHKGEMVRPESRVSIAIGKVESFKEAKNDNVKVSLEVTGAKYPFSGFMNDNNPAAEIIKEAKERDETIAIRFERKRFSKIDPTIPIKELTANAQIAAKNIVWVVAGVYDFNNKDWILTNDAVSNPDEDPSSVKKDLNSAVFSTNEFFNNPEETKTPVRRTNSDKDWQIRHLVSMFTYVSEHNMENKLGLEPKKLKFLAKYMLRGVDQLQVKVMGEPRPNYSDYSHTKARGMLFSWMRINPLSKEIMSSKKLIQEWMTRFIDESTEIWEWATAEIEK